MCGIAGLINKRQIVDEIALRNMCNAIKHRGPDGDGVYTCENSGIAHRRLSIIDLEGGKQPLSNEDNTIWISFNGEIYNFKELKNDLEKKGHHFKTNSDTEVIVHAYEEWGATSVSKLRGMFAFAILDTNKKEIFLARDHFGIKPLVYYQDEQSFAFASEIAALKTLNHFDNSVDFSSLDQLLCFKYITAPNTAYQKVKKLPPAHYMRVSWEGEIKEIKRYWRLSFKPNHHFSENEWLEQVDATIQDSVKAHLVSDVPFGAFLSGGIDSSLVVSYMAQIMNVPVKTFSIGFNEEDFNETTYARQVADRFGTQHHEEIVLPDGLSLLSDLVAHYGEPFADLSAIPTWYVSRLARRNVTMALSGDAGDELFAGYEIYTNQWARQSEPVPHHLSYSYKLAYKLFSKILPGRFPLRKADFQNWLRFNSGWLGGPSDMWNQDLKNTIGEGYREFYQSSFDAAREATHFQKAQQVDFEHYLPGDVLTKVDIASMMHSLEVRTPLLDIRVVELAATIPQHFNIRKINGQFEGKLLLKKLLGRHFDNTFINRPKKGFAVPVDNWLSNESGQMKQIKDRLLSGGTALSNWFNKDELHKQLHHPRKEMVWKLLVMDEWAK